ncbi:MAG: dihydrolipoamide acyltransferase [Nitrospiraceae bacterium]|nr:dihydrolipoamide acyltransferase [Nitrospiraceae bacterium]
MDDRIGEYTSNNFPRSRKNISLILEQGKRRHIIHSLIEVDVSEGRKMIRAIKDKTGKKISFTGWMVKCIAQTISEYPEFNTFKHGRNKLITFHDVDVALPVERAVGGNPQPMIHIIRKANEKSVEDITEEIRAVQEEQISTDAQVLGASLTRFERFALGAPIWLKRLMLRFFRNNAFLRKKHFGTCSVTTIGTVRNFQGWNIAIGGNYTLQIAIGGITKKPAVVDDKIAVREFLSMNTAVDHDIVDGSPMARFTVRLRELVGECYGLKNEALK